MATITNLARFVSGLPREVDVSTNTPQVDSIKVGTTSPVELTKAMATLLDTTTNGAGLPGANLSDGAKQDVLEQKLAAVHTKCTQSGGYTGFVPTTGNTSDVVTTYVTDAATTDTPVGAGGAISAVAAKGIFVGTVSGANDVGKVMIRFYGGDNGVDDGTGDEIYGVLSEATGVYTLSYKKADGSPYTILADDTSAKFDFYFPEIADLYDFKLDRLLVDAVGGVVDATTAEDLDAVIAAREAADSTLQSAIDAEATARAAADNVEATARAAADVTLQANIDAESTPRAAADVTLQANIDAESTPRAAADVTLQANIDAEETARSLADTTLQANLDVETTARIDADQFSTDVLIDNGITAFTNNIGTGATFWRGQSMTLAGDTELSSVYFRLKGSASATGNYTAKIWASNGTIPTGAVIATSQTVDVATMNPAAFEAVEFAFSSTVSLSAGEYFFVFAAEPGVTGTPTFQYSDGQNVSGHVAETPDSGSSWFDNTANDFWVQLKVIMSALDAEITARSNADTALQNSLDAEETARSLADTTLQANLNTEITARTDADATIQSTIDTDATARANADTTLQANIDAEETARSLADTTLQANIDAEETARTLADTTLQANIGAEGLTESYETDNSENYVLYAPTSVETWFGQGFQLDSAADIDTVKFYLRTGSFSGMVSGTIEAKIHQDDAGKPGTVIATSQSVDPNTFSSSVTWWQSFTFSSPVSLSSGTAYHVTLNPVSLVKVDNNSSFYIRRDTSGTYANGTGSQSSDGTTYTIQSAFDYPFQVIASASGIIGDRADGDTTLQTNLDAEITARINGDNVSIDAEITARLNADSTLQANIDAESTPRAAADVTLQANIDAEETARSLADTTLQANIDAEETARADADSTLQSNLDAEITARTDADATIQTNIDNINFTRIDVTFTAGEAITAGDIVVASETVAGEVVKADATAFTTCEDVVGVATESKASSEAIIIRTFGVATVTTDGTNFDLGKRVYVHTTAGQGSKTAPSTDGNVVYLLGNATTATNSVFVNPSLEYVVGDGVGEVGAGEELPVGEGEELEVPAT